jgi:hypothetical protein
MGYLKEGLGVAEGDELLVDVLESGLELDEAGAELEVLDDLGGLIEGFDEGIELSVLADPNSVLVVAGVLLAGVSGLVISNVLDGLADVDLSLLKSLGGVVTELGVGDDLGFVVVDVVGEVNGDLKIEGGSLYSVTSSLVGSVDGVVFLLVLEDTGNESVEEEDDFVFRGLSLNVGLDGAQEQVSECILIDLTGIMKMGVSTSAKTAWVSTNLGRLATASTASNATMRTFCILI